MAVNRQSGKYSRRANWGWQSMTDDIKEHRIYLSPHDMDHLRGGMPVHKGIGEDAMITLQALEWEELEELQR